VIFNFDAIRSLNIAIKLIINLSFNFRLWKCRIVQVNFNQTLRSYFIEESNSNFELIKRFVTNSIINLDIYYKYDNEICYKGFDRSSARKYPSITFFRILQNTKIW